MNLRIPCFALAALAVAAAPALACPKPTEVKAQHLYGLWRAEITGAPSATLLFEKHPEDEERLSGGVNRAGVQGLIAAEVDEKGEFAMEESPDGRRIGATWMGEVVDGSCGREIRGTWQRDGETQEFPFVLRKL